MSNRSELKIHSPSQSKTTVKIGNAYYEPSLLRKVELHSTVCDTIKAKFSSTEVHSPSGKDSFEVKGQLRMCYSTVRGGKELCPLGRSFLEWGIGWKPIGKAFRKNIEKISSPVERSVYQI